MLAVLDEDPRRLGRSGPRWPEVGAARDPAREDTELDTSSHQSGLEVEEVEL